MIKKFLTDNILYLFIGILVATSFSYSINFNAMKELSTASYNSSYNRCFKIKLSWIQRTCLKSVYSSKKWKCKKFHSNVNKANKCIQEIEDKRIKDFDWAHSIFILFNLFLIFFTTFLLSLLRKVVNSFNHNSIDHIDLHLDKIIHKANNFCKKLKIPFSVLSYFLTLIIIVLTCIFAMYFFEGLNEFISN